MSKQDTRGIRPYSAVQVKPRGTGPESAGQSGDTQGLSDLVEAGSESVEELIEEGQAYEASVIAGIENAPDADVSEVHTKQVPEEDVPDEYLDQTRKNTR